MLFTVKRNQHSYRDIELSIALEEGHARFTMVPCKILSKQKNPKKHLKIMNRIFRNIKILFNVSFSVSVYFFRCLAHLHAYSSIIQRDSEEQLIELWPFAVEGASFRDIYQEKMERVKEQVRLD